MINFAEEHRLLSLRRYYLVTLETPYTIFRIILYQMKNARLCRLGWIIISLISLPITPQKAAAQHEVKLKELRNERAATRTDVTRK